MSSREVAKNFEKEHFNVTRDIENIIEALKNTDKSKLRSQPIKIEGLKKLTTEKSAVKISELFIESEFEHKGNVYKEYLLTRDGFTLLAMGFTGKKALEWKLKYIEAFNRMEDILKGTKGISKSEKSSKVGGINGLIRTLNSIMKEEGLPAWKRAEVLKDIMEQYGLDIPEDFVNRPSYLQLSLTIPIEN